MVTLLLAPCLFLLCFGLFLFVWVFCACLGFLFSLLEYKESYSLQLEAFKGHFRFSYFSKLFSSIGKRFYSTEQFVMCHYTLQLNQPVGNLCEAAEYQARISCWKTTLILHALFLTLWLVLTSCDYRNPA